MKKFLLFFSIGGLFFSGYFIKDISANSDDEHLEENLTNVDIELQSLPQKISKRVVRNWSTSKYYDDSTASIGYKPIPRSITVEELRGRQLYRGRLTLVSYYRAPGKYVATYSGTLYKTNNGYNPLSKKIIEVNK